MRCFIAIDIDKAVIGRINDLQLDFKKQTTLFKSKLKWVRPENIHLTLKFFGEVTEIQTAQICALVHNVIDSHHRFEIDLKGTGCFGSPARVFWAGIEGNEMLSSLQKDIEQSMINAGFPAEQKDFTSHLTLCRIKSFDAGEMIRKLADNYSDIEFGTSKVNAVRVYKSELTPQGAIYTQICKINMKNKLMNGFSGDKHGKD